MRLTASRTGLAVAAVLALALALRVAVVLATPGYAPFADAVDYDAHGVSIAAGAGYPPTLLGEPGSPSALRPPGYPVLLGAVYAVAGPHSWTWARLAGAVLGTLVVLLLFLLARAMGGARTGLVAAAIAAVFPPLVLLNASLLTEPLFLVLEVAALLALTAARGRPRLVLWAAACGALCGLAALTRSAGLLLLLPAVFVLWRAGPGGRRSLAAPAVAVLAAAAVVLPWTVRNAVVLGAFVPISTQGGPTAAGTYNADAARPGPLYAVWRPPQFVGEFRPLFAARPGEAELAAELGSRARRFALDHPGYAVQATARNVLRSFDAGPGHARVSAVSYAEMGVPEALRGWASWSAWAIAALAAAGAALALRTRRLRHGFVWVAPLLGYALAMPLTGTERLRAPLDPFLVLLAAVAVAAVAGRVRRG